MSVLTSAPVRYPTSYSSRYFDRMAHGGGPAPDVPSRPPRPVYRDVHSLCYFHPHLTSMDEVRRTLLPHIDQNGSFLVRISTSREKTYTVSVVYNNSIKHFKILKKQQKYYLQDKVFPSIDDLITYYATSEVPNLENIQNVLLRFPIINSETEKSLLPMNQESGRSYRVSGSISSQGSVSSTGGRGSISSVGSSMDEDDLSSAYNKLFPSDRSMSMRQLPPPPGSRIMPGQSVPSGRRRTESHHVERKTSYDETPRRQGRGRVRSDNLDERPPAPLPLPVAEPSKSDPSGIYNGIYYSCIKHMEKSKLPELLEALKMSPANEATHCECGLDLELSQLPQGWSVHISREGDAGYGRPFFMNPAQVTSWDLPRDVYLELNRHQQKFVKYICDNYEKGNAPPDENTQIQWSSSSSSGSLPEIPVRTNIGAASSANRDSTGSNTGASGQGALIGRGTSQRRGSVDPSGASSDMC